MMNGSEKELFVEQGAFLEVQAQQLKSLHSLLAVERDRREAKVAALVTDAVAASGGKSVFLGAPKAKGVAGSSGKASRPPRPHRRWPYLHCPGSATATSSQLERRPGAAWCQNQLLHRQTHRPRAHLVVRDITKLSYFHPISSHSLSNRLPAVRI
ncbi:hypothetical protein Aduo_005436 [Ancylostoma duodenale]